ncbi:MAG: YfhO family protein [Eubacterium sp.]|nr:YfhO family protein [Eubacterium sp.]
MDLTLSGNKLKTTKLLNGETVNYSIAFFAVSMLFVFLKQLLRIAFSLSTQPSLGISFAICAAVLFVINKKFVFNHNQRGSLFKQIIFYLLNIGVDLALFKVSDFVFRNIENADDSLAFIISAFAFYFFNYYFQRIIVFDCTNNPIKRKGGKAYKAFFENRFILLSMLLALISISFVYLVSTMFPFGNFTVMRMDLYHQYGPLFCELYDRVVNHQSFLYSWNLGGGSSFLGNYFNYLSSPLSFIIFLFDRKEMTFAITTMVAVKGILSAGAFSLYLKHSQKGHSFASSAFGVFYAFCGYFLAYYWNIMWMDALIIFPFIVLGIERIINENKPLCYIVSLCVLFYSSYYMGYMACIFSVVYFIAYFFISAEINSKKSIASEKKANAFAKLYENRFINRGITFALSSLLCGALCAFVLIPVYMILQQSSATTDTFPSSFESYFDIFSFISSHLAGLETTIRSSGDDVLPNVYCSVLTVILLPLYLINKDIRLKEKTVYILLLIFFLFSFDCNYANFIWHAFHFPNDLPYRFSYMYSFLLLVIAFKALKKFKSLEYRDIAFSGILWVAALVLFEKFPTEKFTESTVYISLAFVIIWTGVLMLIKNNKLSEVIIGITIISIAFSEVIIADTSSYVFTQKQNDYVLNYDTYEEAIDKTYSADDSLYRSELCYLDTRMDPCLYGYRGMSVFSSMAYEDYSQTQFNLGLAGNRINSYTYNTQTPVYNMMFGIKYLMQKEDYIIPSGEFYNQTFATKDNQTKVFENKYFLPFAFETSSDISEWINEEGNPFEVQEDLIDRAAGVSDLFVPVEYGETQCEGCTSDDVTENGTYFYTANSTDEISGTIDVKIKATQSSNIYVYLTSPVIENVNYYWNKEEESKYPNFDEPYIIDLGYHKKGDEITASLSLSGTDNDSSYFEIYAYSVDKEVLNSAYDILKLGALDVSSFSDTEIEGTINAGYNGYIYTSIPYDKGWSVYIDGKKAETIKIGDCQLGAKIKEGSHKIRFKYTPVGLKAGAAVSAFAWLAVLIILALRKTKFSNLVKTSKKK